MYGFLLPGNKITDIAFFSLLFCLLSSIFVSKISLYVTVEYWLQRYQIHWRHRRRKNLRESLKRATWRMILLPQTNLIWLLEFAGRRDQWVLQLYPKSIWQGGLYVCRSLKPWFSPVPTRSKLPSDWKNLLNPFSSIYILLPVCVSMRQRSVLQQNVGMYLHLNLSKNRTHMYPAGTRHRHGFKRVGLLWVKDKKWRTDNPIGHTGNWTQHLSHDAQSHMRKMLSERDNQLHHVPNYI